MRNYFLGLREIVQLVGTLVLASVLFGCADDHADTRLFKNSDPRTADVNSAFAEIPTTTDGVAELKLYTNVSPLKIQNQTASGPQTTQTVGLRISKGKTDSELLLEWNEEKIHHTFLVPLSKESPAVVRAVAGEVLVVIYFLNPTSADIEAHRRQCLFRIQPLRKPAKVNSVISSTMLLVNLQTDAQPEFDFKSVHSQTNTFDGEGMDGSFDAVKIAEAVKVNPAREIKHQ